jgi:hypothetical protein
LSFTRDKLKYYVVVVNVLDKEIEDAYNEALGKLLLEKGNIETKKAQARRDEGYKTLLGYKTAILGVLEMLRKDEQRFESNCMSLRSEIKSRELNNNF